MNLEELVIGDNELFVMFRPTWITSSQFESVVGRHDYAEHLTAGGMVTLGFRERTSLLADIGLRLLSFINQLAALGYGRVRLVFESDQSLYGYLNRNGFLRHLAPAVETVPARPALFDADLFRGMARGLVEIAEITPGVTGPARQEIVRPLVDALMTHYPLSDHTTRLQNHALTVLTELIDNVFSHSETEQPGFALLQAYTQGLRPRVQVAVSDSGVGIPESIRAGLGAKVKLKSDSDLILEAFVGGGLSRLGRQSGRGCGLPRCWELAVDYQSRVVVRTRSAHVTLIPRSDGQEPQVQWFAPSGAMLGTHVCLEFMLDGRT